jgi:hypothetical protein
MVNVHLFKKNIGLPIDDTFCNAYNQLLTDANCIIPPNRGIMQFADRGIIKNQRA